MRRFLILLTVAIVVFVAVFRQRLFLWDPLAKVTRDGVVDPDARVKINYSNDVLLDDATPGHRRLYVVQNWNHAAAIPARMKCVGTMVCLTEADQVPGELLQVGRRGAAVAVTMSNKEVRFADEDGAVVEVKLR